MAGLVAASNSTASALLAAMATLAENDSFRRFLPGKTSAQYLWFGRLVLALGGLLGIVFSFYVDKVGIIKANFDIMSVFEPPIFVIVAGALFWRRANAIGATIALVGGIGLGALGALTLGYTAEVRTFLAFPVCIVLLAVGSLIGEAISPRSEEESAKVDDLIARTRGVQINWSDRGGSAGVAIAVLSLVAFILCAVFEEVLPRPHNLFVFMGLMLTFVVGCYVAVPTFMPDAAEGQETEVSALDDSLVQRVLGSGWSWLAIGVLALVLVVVLYVI